MDAADRLARELGTTSNDAIVRLAEEGASARARRAQIAACAWTHGRGLATENLRDFEVLRDLIAQLYPQTTPLVVTASPAT